MSTRRNYKIYAVDFDGTLCESVWPGIGEPNMVLIEHLKKRRRQGHKIILWTCRVGERLQEAVDWCKGYGLEFDAVNENLPEMIKRYGGDSRKVVANVYIDDHCINKPKYHVPYKAKKEDNVQPRIFVDGIEMKPPKDTYFDIPKVLFPDCDYFNDERDSEYSPDFGDCQFCYRYEICLEYYKNEMAKGEGRWLNW